MSGELNEQELFSETPEVAAQRIIREAAPFAAQSIATIACDETVSANTRLNAAKYIIDRNLGPVGGAGDQEQELEKFLRQLNAEANGGR